MDGDQAEYLRLAWSINPTKTARLINMQVPNIEVNPSTLSQFANVDYFNFNRFLRQFQTSTDELLTANAKGRIQVV